MWEVGGAVADELIHTRPKGGLQGIPRISWGKYFESDGRFLLPHSVQAHHGLIDGLHIGKYFTLFQQLLNQPEILIS